MKILEISNIPKLYFGYEDIARVLGISESSARVSASRYVRQGALVRIKYLEEKLASISNFS